MVTKKQAKVQYPVEYVPHEAGDETIERWGMAPLVCKTGAALSRSGKSWAHALAQPDDYTFAMALIREVTRGCYGATLAYTRFRGDAQLLEATKALLAESRE